MSNSREIKGVIFDLDGTLLDTEILWVAAVEGLLADLELIIRHEEALQMVYGRSWTDIYVSLVEAYPVLEIGSSALDAKLCVYFDKLKSAVDVRLHSSIALLHRLAETYPCCIVSGSPCAEIKSAIELMEVDEQVEFFIGAEEYGNGKPDPTCFLMGAERLGVAPEFCVVFEDSCAGVAAAKSAGMLCVALARPEAPAQDVRQADLIVADLADFTFEALLGDA